MQGDSIHALVRLKDWKSRVQSLRSSAIRLQTQRDALTREHEKAVNEVGSLTLMIEKYTKTGELLRALMDKLVLDQIKTIESVVSEGLKSIFFDQALQFETEVGQSRGKVTIDLLIRRSQDGIDIIGPPLETVGGGVSSIASLTLRLLALMRLKKFPFLLLDETLSAVSADYVDLTGQFLAKLSESSNIPILLVTHNEMFLNYAKSAYQGYEKQSSSDQGWSLGLKKFALVTGP